MKELKNHYRSMFTLSFLSSITETHAWQTVLKQIGSWLYNKYNQDPHCKNIVRHWFFTEGIWRPLNQKDVVVQTISLGDTGINNVPKYWSLRLEHQDASNSFRIWRIDLAITFINKNNIQIVVGVDYYTKPGYFGIEPDDPPTSIPRIVSDLLSIPGTKCFIGKTELSNKATIVECGMGKKLVEQITDSERICPIVVVSPDQNNNYNIQIEDLVNDLKGNAVVFLLDNDPATMNEIQYYFGSKYPSYNIPNNCVRIYNPKLDVTKSNDSLRHRFISLTTENGVNDAISIIAKSCYRNIYIPFSDYISNVDDIRLKNKELSRQTLLLKTNKTKEEYEALSNMFAEDLADRKAEIKTLNEELVDCRNEVKELYHELEQLEHTKDNINSQCNELKVQNEVFKKRDVALKGLLLRPSSAVDILFFVFNLYSDRLTITDEAIKSAKSYTKNSIDAIWELFMLFPMKLHPLLFDPNRTLNAIQIANEFNSTTPFEITFNEGPDTKHDKELMKKRLVMSNGQQYDITPHAKTNGAFRIHFAVDRNNNKIIIGHFGEHLLIASHKK